MFSGKTKIPKRDCESALSSGFNVTSLVIGKAAFAKLNRKEGLFYQFSGFEIGVIQAEALAELRALKSEVS